MNPRKALTEALLNASPNPVAAWEIYGTLLREARAQVAMGTLAWADCIRYADMAACTV